MMLDTLVVDQDEATRKLDEYATMLNSERTAEDEAIEAGYKAAARGLPVIRLSAAVAAGGYFDDGGMPKIAVVRADARECFAYWSRNDIVFADQTMEWAARSPNRRALVNDHTVRVTPGNAPHGYRRHNSWWGAARTSVPLIPPSCRPRLRRIRGFHILWEVEEWRRVPPRDPALIKHIRGDLWSVHAAWDMTELERAVLSQRP